MLLNLEELHSEVFQMREEIRTHLKAETEMRELIEFIGEESTRAEVMERIIRYVPCIMHAENRCGIFFLKYSSSRVFRTLKEAIFLTNKMRTIL